MKGPHRRLGRNRPAEEPIGVILAGGRGRRIGGSKATVQLRGKPLISYPLGAMRSALREVVVLAKADTELPDLPGATIWIEPQPRHHPVVGLIHALGLAGGRSVLVCAVDLPLVTPALIGRIANQDAHGAPAVVAADHGQVHPLLGRYDPVALPLLRRQATDADARLRDQVSALGPRPFEVDDPEMLFNVNAPEDLLQAAVILGRKRSPSRT